MGYGTFFAVFYSYFGACFLFYMLFLGKPGCTNMLAILVMATSSNKYNRLFSF